MDWQVLLGFLPSYFLMIYLSIPFHELGHLAAGLLSGYRFNSFRVLSWIWLQKEGKIHFTKSKNMSFIAGQCLMAPTDNEEDFKFIFYNLGGVLVNFIIAVLSFVFLLGQRNAILFGIFWGICIANLFLGLVNIIPFTSNDGRNILNCLKSRRTKHGMYMTLKTNEEMSKGKRYRDYTEQDFQLYPDDDFGNDMVFALAALESARLYDLGAYEKSLAIFDSINTKKLSKLYQNSIQAEYLYHALVHNPDFEKAKEIYQNSELQKFLQMSLPTNFRIRIAYEYFINQNKEKTENLFTSAYAFLDSYPVMGVAASERDYLDYLKEKIRLHEMDTSR